MGPPMMFLGFMGGFVVGMLLMEYICAIHVRDGIPADSDFARAINSAKYRKAVKEFKQSLRSKDGGSSR